MSMFASPCNFCSTRSKSGFGDFPTAAASDFAFSCSMPMPSSGTVVRAVSLSVAKSSQVLESKFKQGFARFGFALPSGFDLGKIGASAVALCELVPAWPEGSPSSHCLDTRAHLRFLPLPSHCFRFEFDRQTESSGDHHSELECHTETPRNAYRANLCCGCLCRAIFCRAKPGHPT